MRLSVIAVLPLLSCGPDAAPPGVRDPGQVVAHRLNRAEYNNTVRDLFATTQRPADNFPADDFTLGFSNIADTLSISATHLELYEIAADDLLAEISTGRTLPQTTVIAEAELATGAGVPFGTMRNLWEEGDVVFSVTLPAGGWWNLSVTGVADPGVTIRVIADGGALPDAALATGQPISSSLELTEGPHQIVVGLADLTAVDGIAPFVALDAIVLTGPVGVAVDPGPGRGAIFTCDPEVLGEAACAEQIVRQFGRRAWRRPLTDDEVDRLLTLYGTALGAGSSWEEAVRLSLKGILLAPWFVYRVEVDPDPGSQVPRPLEGYELASRLSYFLWSSTPDEDLLDLAASGALLRPEVLRGQVDRMLRDPKAGALVETLGVEWLYLARVDEATPDAEMFPAFDESLRESMKEELSLFTGSILLGDRSMLELLTGTETWIDARLAAHYGVAPPDGPGFVQRDIPERPGIVARAGWLTSLSYPTRTSPVRRGKWVVESLMCEPPPPLPANVVPALPGDTDPEVTLSVRDQFEQHRADPVCAQCHVVMDGIGFGLENYDAIGQYRTEDEFGNPIDASGALVSGATFSGPDALGDALAGDPKTARCMVQKVFTFALGRVPRVEDLAALAEITDAFVANDYRFSVLASEIIASDAFRYRTPAEGSP